MRQTNPTDMLQKPRFEAWALFGFAFFEVCMMTSWPLHTKDIGHPSMLACLVSTFAAIPVATYYFLVAKAARTSLHPRGWLWCVRSRQALISYVLLNPWFYAIACSVLCCWQWLVARVRGRSFDAYEAFHSSIRGVAAAVVVCFGLMGGNGPVAVAIVVFACLPLQPQHVTAAMMDLAVFYLYCSTWMIPAG